MRKAKQEDLNEIYMMGYDVWADGMSKEKYLKACHGSSKYAKGQWYVLEDCNGKLLSSLITYKLDQVEEKSAIGIGSIATTPSHRGKGHGKQLIKDVIRSLDEHESCEIFFLHADIKPEYYEDLESVRLPDKFQSKPGSVAMMRCSQDLREKVLASPSFKSPAYF